VKEEIGENILMNSIVEIAKYILPVLSAALIWLLNERSKRKSEQYQRREIRYSALINSIDGFYVESTNRNKKQDFLNELNQCWLYCPDIVIKKAYHFLDTVRVGNQFSEEEREKALGDLMTEIRIDLARNKSFIKTKLNSKDFRIIATS